MDVSVKDIEDPSDCFVTDDGKLTLLSFKETVAVPPKLLLLVVSLH